jgi:hypothetical protein
MKTRYVVRFPNGLVRIGRGCPSDAMIRAWLDTHGSLSIQVGRGEPTWLVLAGRLNDLPIDAEHGRTLLLSSNLDTLASFYNGLFEYANFVDVNEVTPLISA